MGYTYSLTKLMMYFAQNRVYPECETQKIDFDTVEGSGIGANRETLVLKALDSDCTHILFIDEDTIFAPHALHTLASKRKEVVGGNYPMRFKDCGFTALTLDKKARVITGPNSVGLEQVYYTGFGFCLIERSVFEKMKRPWFLIGYNTDRNIYTTEDVAFGAQLMELGIPWYVDHDASKLLTHMGSYAYHWKETFDALQSAEVKKNGE
jgi:hypothetical protein